MALGPGECGRAGRPPNVALPGQIHPAERQNMRPFLNAHAAETSKQHESESYASGLVEGPLAYNMHVMDLRDHSNMFIALRCDRPKSEEDSIWIGKNTE